MFSLWGCRHWDIKLYKKGREREIKEATDKNELVLSCFGQIITVN